MSLPLGLYGLPMSAGNAGEETVMTQASNDAYAEFRRQMLSQVNATKGKRKSSLSGNGSSRPGSVTGDDEDMNNSDMHHGIIETNYHFRVIQLFIKSIVSFFFFYSQRYGHAWNDDPGNSVGYRSAPG